ncbi:hypothetical protein LJB42_002609 [Komagataella kurtzmanii]|nr:hypothetical protein LJB42_002609 [Komagataella kurtzmanii]
MVNSNEIPKVEQLIYDKIGEYREQLTALKMDHSKFMKSTDIVPIYRKMIATINELKVIRRQEKADLHLEHLDLPNKVDLLIDETFQVVSLCLMTVGLTRTAPATYVSLSTVQRLLEHIGESEIYTHLDLVPIEKRLKEIEDIISQDEADQSLADREDEHELLKFKLKQCKNEYNSLLKVLEKVPKSLEPILNSLISIRRALMSILAHTKVIQSDDELHVIQKELNEIKTQNIDKEGNFLDPETKEVVVESQGLLKGLYYDCMVLVKDILFNDDKVDPALKEIFSTLLEIKSNLEGLLITSRWTLRKTDLFQYQKQLDAIDNARQNGYFVAPDGSTPKKGQIILLYLLRRSYATIYKLLESSEPVSEALQPLHNQLTTVRRCLIDLKTMGGISSLRELYPYQLKLASLDNLRVDGKFMVDGEIPEGQGTLNALLSECFDITHELTIEMYERNENSDEQDAPVEGLVIGTKGNGENREQNYDYEDPNAQGHENEDDEEDEEDEEDSEELPSYAPTPNESDADST